MSKAPVDRTDPNHDWTSTGDGQVASTDDPAAAVAHLKAWFAQELAKLMPASKTAPAPKPSDTKGA